MFFRACFFNLKVTESLAHFLLDTTRKIIQMVLHLWLFPIWLDFLLYYHQFVLFFSFHSYICLLSVKQHFVSLKKQTLLFSFVLVGFDVQLLLYIRLSCSRVGFFYLLSPILIRKMYHLVIELIEGLFVIITVYFA